MLNETLHRRPSSVGSSRSSNVGAGIRLCPLAVVLSLFATIWGKYCSLTAAALHESPFVSIPTRKDLGPACAMNCLEIGHSRLLCLGHLIHAVTNAATKPEVNRVGAALWPRAARGRIIRLHICNGSSLPALFVVGVLVQLAQITRHHWRFCHEILDLPELEPLRLHNLHFIPKTHHERRHPRYWA